MIDYPGPEKYPTSESPPANSEQPRKKLTKFKFHQESLSFLPGNSLEQARSELARLRLQKASTDHSVLGGVYNRLVNARDDTLELTELNRQIDDLARKIRIAQSTEEAWKGSSEYRSKNPS